MPYIGLGRARVLSTKLEPQCIWETYLGRKKLVGRIPGLVERDKCAIDCFSIVLMNLLASKRLSLSLRGAAIDA